MAVIYVDPTNSVAGSGSYSNPFQAWPTMTAGNTYLLKAGTTYTGKVSVTNSGNSAALRDRIVLGAYGDGPNPIIVGTDYCIQISTDKKYITVDGLELTGATARGIGNATTASSPTVDTFITVQNCSIHDLVAGGSDVNGIQLWGFGNKVLANTVYNIPTDAMWFGCKGIEVAYNRVYAVSTDGRNNGDCIQFGLASDNFWCHHNDLDHSDVDYKQVIMTVDDGTGSGGIIEYNTCRHYNGANAAAAIYGGQPGLVIRRNIVYGGNVGINSTRAGLVIEANLVFNDFNRGIDLGTLGVMCRNNTVLSLLGTGVIGIRYITAGSIATLRNNIVQGFATGLSLAASAYVEEYNCLYGNTTNSNRTLGTGTITSDPRLDSRHIPQDYAARVGGALTGSAVVDRNGARFSYPPSIGAIQAQEARRLALYRALVG